MQKIHRDYIIKTFRQLGFSEDLRELYITVLRETDFPFRRITLPNNSDISTELIRIYLEDLRIQTHRFYSIMERLFPQAQPQNDKSD